jgi:hypothetical protein
MLPFVSYGHRYLRNVDCSRHISLQNIHFQQNKGASSGYKTRQIGLQSRLAGLNNIPTLTANIFAAATKITNINNKTGSRRL